jgi:hypothetical protein
VRRDAAAEAFFAEHGLGLLCGTPRQAR